MGETTELTVLAADGEVRTRRVTVAPPKGKKLHFLSPALVAQYQTKMIPKSG
jgi:hypothetical protein